MPHSRAIDPRDAELLQQILTRLRVVKGPDSRGESVCWCVFHADGQGKPPHQPNLHVGPKGFFCHACKWGASFRQLAKLLGINVGEGKSGDDIEVAYDYRDEKGELLFQVVRRPGKDFNQRRPDGKGGWIWNLRGVRRVPYPLPELVAKADAMVFAVEAEKDAHRLATLGLVATRNPSGAGKWRNEYSQFLAGRDVVIVRDNDAPGREHAEDVAQSLAGVAQTVKLLELQGLPKKGDVSDWLDAGHTVGELQRLAPEAPVWQPPAQAADSKSSDNSAQRDTSSQADRLIALVLDDSIKLFHDDLGEAFARVPVAGHHEVLRCRGKSFRQWLAGRMWRTERKAPNSDARNAALEVIEAVAHFERMRLHGSATR